MGGREGEKGVEDGRRERGEEGVEGRGKGKQGRRRKGYMGKNGGSNGKSDTGGGGEHKERRERGKWWWGGGRSERSHMVRAHSCKCASSIRQSTRVGNVHWLYRHAGKQGQDSLSLPRSLPRAPSISLPRSLPYTALACLTLAHPSLSLTSPSPSSPPSLPIPFVFPHSALPLH